MNRREFIAGLGSAAVWPVVTRAQQPSTPVIGYIYPLSREVRPEFTAAFRRGLADTGYAEGRNVVIEYRFADGDYDRLPALLVDLVRRQVAVIAAPSISPTLLKVSTQTIPIVFSIGSDPVESGAVESLNRPGGNLTGVSVLNTEVMAKRVELLHELVPTATTFGILVNQANLLLSKNETQQAQIAADALGVHLLVLNASGGSDIEAAFTTMVEHRVSGFLVNSDPVLQRARSLIVALAAHHRLPAIYHFRDVVVDGGLMSYGPDLIDAFRLVGDYSGRILRGERPAELPVQRSVKIELAINLKSAKALGLTIPETLLATADEVIQ